MIWVNGNLLPPSEATIPALDRGVLWGYGLFETMRRYDGRIFALEDHLERLRAGAEIIELPLPSRDHLAEGVEAVTTANDLDDAGVRVTITRGTGPPEPHLDPDGPPNVIITCWGVSDNAELRRDGVALITLPGGPRPLAEIKTTSYMASVAGRLLARRAGADDGVFVDGDRILEGTGSNLFMASGDTLVTPPLNDDVLPGVTRLHVIEVARAHGFTVELAPVSVEDVRSADEVVLTSSVREIYPARSLDGKPLQRAGIADRLWTAFRAHVAGSPG